MPAAEAEALSCEAAGLEVGSLFHDLHDVALVAVAVSGGSDSMALLRLLAAWRGQGLVALTVDHGLRDGSRAEAERVGRWCAALGIRHVILSWDGGKPATGIQAKARAARYDLLTGWCNAHGAGVLLTAHTLNDQAETVEMRKRRTSSAASLAGIWPETQWRGVRVVRPLLNVTRCALRAYLRSIGQGWLDDPSNVNTAFERVRIRRSLRQRDIAALGAEALAAQAETRTIEAQAQAWLRAHMQLHETGYVTLARQALSGETPETRAAVLGRAIMLCGSGVRPERADVLRIAGVAEGAAVFRRSLGGAIVAGRTRAIVIGREPGRIAPDPVVIPLSGAVLWDGRFRIAGPVGALVQVAGRLRPPQDTRLPDFVLAGLPVVRMAGQSPFFPHFGRNGRFAVTPGERFHL